MIPVAKEMDSGVYTCRVVGVPGSYQDTARLEVVRSKICVLLELIEINVKIISLLRETELSPLSDKVQSGPNVQRDHVSWYSLTLSFSYTHDFSVVSSNLCAYKTLRFLLNIASVK